MRVNEVIGVAGYVLPGTRVDVVATANPSSRSEDITTKVVLSNVEVLAAGTRLEQDTPDGKPMQVTVVTLLVTPDESERLTLASTEGKIQLALRNPLDTETPVTLRHQARHAARQRAAADRSSSRKPAVPGQPAPIPPPPSVEVIRGDKRTQVVVG